MEQFGGELSKSSENKKEAYRSSLIDVINKLENTQNLDETLKKRLIDFLKELLEKEEGTYVEFQLISEKDREKVQKTFEILVEILGNEEKMRFGNEVFRVIKIAPSPTKEGGWIIAKYFPSLTGKAPDDIWIQHVAPLKSNSESFDISPL